LRLKQNFNHLKKNEKTKKNNKKQKKTQKNRYDLCALNKILIVFFFLKKTTFLLLQVGIRIEDGFLSSYRNLQSFVLVWNEYTDLLICAQGEI